MNRKQRSTQRLAALSLAVAVTLGSLAAAAEPRGPFARGGHHRGPDLERLAGELGLTEDQHRQVRAILEENRAAMHERMREIRAADGDHRERRARMREEAGALRESLRADLAGVLTPAQLAELDVLREQRRMAHREHRERRREERFDHLAEALELHESQMPQVRRILGEAREARREAMRAAHESGLGEPQTRARMEALREETADALAGVLTPVQMTQFERLVEDRARERGRRRGHRGAGDSRSDG